MLGLGYSDSEEDEGVQQPQSKTIHVASSPKSYPDLAKEPTVSVSPVERPRQTAIQGPQQGPALGPSASPPTVAGPTEDAPPASPYTSDRAIIRNLTLPTVPNLNIPASPPGSPPQRAGKKFLQFLELKKKGQHFNQRLEKSTVLKDPGHLQRLMDFAGITEKELYQTTLPTDIVPTEFPEWAYFEQLNESRKNILKGKEEEKAKGKREAIDFVRASGSGTSSGTGTPSGKAGAQSAAERIMAGLSTRTTEVVGSRESNRKRELEHRGGRNDHSARSRNRSRSRSPKRRRSRSRDRDRDNDRDRWRERR